MALRAESLTKRYRGFTAVDHVSLEIERGEVVGLLGPNGAGKTTTFYMIVGLVPCTDGRIILGQHDITQLPMHVRARLGVGYLPQEASVFRKMTVYENILAILEMRRDLTRRGRHDQTEALIDELNVGHCRDTLGMSLSGGERRRVEIARALAADPAFILLDEPFAGVDPISVIDIQQIIQHLRERDIGVLVTDHNVRETLGICARAYIISEGRMIAAGSPDTILTDHKVREVYLGHEFQL